jgi:NAD+ synthase
MKVKEVEKHIVDWLKEYAASAGVSGFTVGISGGIDSALVSTLCCKTGLSTHLVSLPIHQASSHLSRASQHIKQLLASYPNAQGLEIDLSHTFDTLKDIMPTSADQKKYLLSCANDRSRLRMIALYHVAAISGTLVVGTGNKIEDFGVGFFTKWGDGGVDISPIGDLTKSQVYELSRYMGVGDTILTAAPSDGLFDNDQNDEMQLGATYPELEWAMDMVSQGKTPQDFTGRQREVMDIYISRNRANQHKIRPIPVCSIPEEYLI